MANNCLVTKLKAVVDNDNLLKLGELRLKVVTTAANQEVGLVGSVFNDISVVGVGWFLGIIFLFYMLFPFFVFLMDNKRRAWITMGVVVLLFFSVKFYFHPVKGTSFGNDSFMRFAPIFMIGGLVYLYREKFVNLSMCFRWILRILTIGYTTWFFVFPEMRFSLSNLVMYVLWILYAVSEVSLKRRTLLNNQVMAFFSGISMEIYLCHMMFFRVVEKFHFEKIILDNDMNYWTTSVLVLIGATTFAWSWKKWGEPNVLKLIEN
jgi:peptidoglycan/LPS O-acetylase OafA/YrhL